MRKLLWASIILMFSLIGSFLPQVARARPLSSSSLSTASELIDAVNALRASYGLPPYTQNSILMSIAQKQADYNLSIGTITHIGPDGLRPFQRALQAGYPVAGDLNQGGFFSENITAGVGKTAEEAVENWTGDSPHLNTMISSDLQDIGAGVAVSGNTYYYLIDCGRSTGGAPRPFTPPPSYIPPKATMIPNTPNADGSITYIVQRGDTALGIVLSYGISLDKLRTLNGLNARFDIYPDQKLIIRAAYTPTPTLPTSTPTGLPTITSWPTSTPTSTTTLVPPTSSPSPGLPVSTASRSVTIIVASALILAALFALLGRKR